MPPALKGPGEYLTWYQGDERNEVAIPMARRYIPQALNAISRIETGEFPPFRTRAVGQSLWLTGISEAQLPGFMSHVSTYTVPNAVPSRMRPMRILATNMREGSTKEWAVANTCTAVATSLPSIIYDRSDLDLN